MFEIAQQSISTKIQTYCTENDIPQLEQISWQPIPFSGEWGFSTSFFQVAALEARAGKKVNVPQRAQEIAEGVAAFLGTPDGFSRIEPVKGIQPVAAACKALCEKYSDIAFIFSRHC